MTGFEKRLADVQVKVSSEIDHPKGCDCDLCWLYLNLSRDRKDHIGDVDEFNAGFEAAKAGKTEADEPQDSEHDSWMPGFAWQKYEGLKAEVVSLTAQIDILEHSNCRCCREKQSADSDCLEGCRCEGSAAIDAREGAKGGST